MENKDKENKKMKIDEEEKVKKKKMEIEDEENKDKEKDKDKDKDKEKEKEKEDPKITLIKDFCKDIELLNKGVIESDDKIIGRSIRQVFYKRRKLEKEILDILISIYIPTTQKRRNLLLDYLQQYGLKYNEVTSEDIFDPPKFDDKITKMNFTKKNIVLPEIEVFLHILVIVLLLDMGKIGNAKNLSTLLVKDLKNYRQKTMSQLSAKAYFFYSRSYELNHEISEIRKPLLQELQKCTTFQDNHGKIMTINLLLRNYLSENLYEQASKLLSKVTIDEFRSNAQLARYFYYKGRIKTIQLDYTEAYNCLTKAVQKMPSHGANGFRLSVEKFRIIVKLCMGEIPSRSIFFKKGIKGDLTPYFELTNQVRIGDLFTFKKIVQKFEHVFKRDKTYSLTQRIRQNVIRTGLKKISLSYSKISFDDISKKLKLDNTDDVECIVSKAIKDGIIDAIIDEKNGYIKSKQVENIYSTTLPSDVFKNRIDYLRKITEESVKALEYKEKDGKKIDDDEQNIGYDADEIIESDEDYDDVEEF